MVFSSFVFLSLFLPAVLLLDRLLPEKVRNGFLLAFSLLLYAWGEPVCVLLLIGCAFVNWIAARNMEKHRKAVLILSLIADLGILCAFKYTGFLVRNLNALTGLSLPVPEIRMPVGISFFTFQAMSYTLDVYRGECRPQRSFSKLLLYIALFPQLIAGPIVRYSEIEQALEYRRASRDEFMQGARRFCVGLAKKVLIANTLAQAADAVYGADPGLWSLPVAWLGVVCYAFQIYFDFSGYSDMALGMGRMLGFSFPENFRYPYAARSLQDFWRRWHISLSVWFRTYVYIPLGGNRRGKGRAVLNRLIVFFLTGLWHGADWTFVLWGLGNGLLLMLETSGILPVSRLKKGWRWIGHLYVWLSFLMLFVLFRADSLSQACMMYKALFTRTATGAAGQLFLAGQMNGRMLATLIAAFLCAMPFAELFREKTRLRRVLTPLSYVFALVLLWFSLLSLASQSYNPFIYFRF